MPEETLCCSSIPSGLQIHIDHLTILVNCPPEVILLAVDFDECFIDVECVTVAAIYLLASQEDMPNVGYQPLRPTTTTAP